MPDFAPAIELSALDSDTGITIEGTLAGERLGTDVASAGDMNGDGYDDFIVSVSKGANPGLTYVVFGGTGGFPATLESSLDGSNGFQISGAATPDALGWSVASAGDINGDGYDDIIIGARLVPNQVRNGSGAAYVVLGHAGGFAADVNVSTLNGANGFTIAKPSTNEQVGYSVGSAGDVNGDGYDDMIIGAPDGGSTAGAAYVVFGKAGGFADIDLATLDGVNGFELDGLATGNLTGRAVASAGDVNGDGYDDVIIGAQGADVNGAGSGSAYVVFGKAGGFAASLSLGSLDGTNGFTLNGVLAGDAAGVSVSSAGDVNGDGYDDLMVGGGGADPYGVTGAGAAYVIFGHAGSFSPSLTLSALDGSNGFRLSGAAAGDSAGISVAAAGDVNGDGHDDIIVGASAADPGGRTNAGATYVIFGNPAGFAAEMNLSSLNGANGFAINGVGNLDGAGRGADSAGDVNGDGYDDIILSASLADPQGTASGSAYIVFGHATPINITGGAGDETITGGADIDTLSGGGGKDILYGLAGDDSLTGGTEGDWLDGGIGADAMSGGTGDDTYVVDDAGDTTLEAGGEGKDVVRASINWTLSANIETLILEGSANLNGTGNTGANSLYGNDGANVLDGADGDDLIKGGAGDDTLTGGNGSDMLYGGDGIDSADGQGGNDILSGGNGDDIMYGGIGNDQLDGGADNDTLDGGTGADRLTGGAGTDILLGGDGNDVLDGGTGADAMTGGLGDDTFYVDDAGDTTIEAAGEGTDIIHAAITWVMGANIENMVLDGSADIGGTGNGLVNAITGNAGANTIDGGAGDDVLKGMNGNDILIGGTGSDILVGGAGADTFVVLQASVIQSHLGGAIEVDTVNDLITAQGDRLDLSAIDADTNTDGDQAFHLVGNFSHQAGEMTLVFGGGVTTLSLDIDGDGAADYRMKITGDVHLDSGGWLL